MVKQSSSTLKKAVGIQKQIEKLDVELQNLLTGGVARLESQGSSRLVPPRAGKQVPKRAQKDRIAAGVRQILQKQRKPMKVGEIYRQLVKAGYSFRSSNPKNSLTAQMYRIRGIRRTGAGEFRAE
jgi:hypothetical protein